MTGRACIPCLRRAWLLGRLAPFIERSCDDRPGRRVPELLALDDGDLVRAVAPRRVDELLTAHSSVADIEIGRALEASGCWAICSHDRGWPEGLLHQADRPACLIGLGDIGLLAGLEPDDAVTIVGSRRATGYGQEVARRLGREAARAGVAVISGMAAGIDGAVHRGSLGVGRSIAVLGGSADRPYPASNRGLFRELVESGAVVSEMPPGSGPRRWCFPARNRTMAALSGLTVVVEAAARSGSLITAEMALSAGREVGAVPGPVTSSVSAGCNDLIRSGAALIRDGFDLIETLTPGRARPEAMSDLPDDPLQLAVLEAIAEGASTADSVAAKTGIDPAGVMVVITTLEFEGLVEVSESGTLASHCPAIYRGATTGPSTDYPLGS